jgi:xylulokinase
LESVTEKASRETDLSTNTIVSTGALDQAAGAVGTGDIKPGIITESTGTALALLATVENPTYDPKRRIPCHHHAAPKKYLLIPWCPTAGAVLRWFRDEFGQYEVEAAKKIKVNAYDLWTLEAAKVPAGSDGLIILPHFMGAGAPEFDPHAKGIIFGLTLKHTKAHVIRAILESIAFMIRRNVELLEELGIQVEEIRSIGGASRSPLWNQIKANVTSRQIITLQIEEAASLGAAILAGVADGTFRSVEEGCKTMVKLKGKYEPQFKDREVYEKLYRVYCSLYNHVKDLFPLL